MSDPTQHPYDLTADAFMALPITEEEGPTPLRSKHDPTGIVDEEGRVWVPMPQEDGSWARKHIFSL